MKYIYLFFIVISVFSCGTIDSTNSITDNNSADNDSTNSNNTLTSNNTNDNLHLQWTKQALSAWNLNLDTSLKANSLNEIPGENTNGTKNSSLVAKNFITIDTLSDQPSTVVGLCEIGYYSSGSYVGLIAQTTLTIRKSYLLSTTISNNHKLSAFIHEIGHCLGLRHSDDSPALSCTASMNTSISNTQQCVMYSSISPKSVAIILPSKEELTAIKSVYKAINNVSSPTNEYMNRFSTVANTTNVIRQFTYPKFYINTSIELGKTLANVVQDPNEISNALPLKKITYIMHSDHTETIQEE